MKGRLKYLILPAAALLCAMVIITALVQQDDSANEAGLEMRPNPLEGGVSLPMYFPPPPFNLEDAIMSAKVVLAAYHMYDAWLKADQPDQSSFQWQCNLTSVKEYELIWADWKLLGLIEEIEPFGIVASMDDGTICVGFRGTKSFEDWVVDFEGMQTRYTFVPDYGSVHKGYWDVYASMRHDISKAIASMQKPKRLFFTGHSMGAALSTLAVPDVIFENRINSSTTPCFHYNFASPRVGNLTFSSSYNQANVHTYRFVNVSDIVPNSVPPIFGELLYEHVGTPVSYTAHYGSVAANHKMTAYHDALLSPKRPKRTIDSTQ